MCNCGKVKEKKDKPDTCSGTPDLPVWILKVWLQ